MNEEPIAHIYCWIAYWASQPRVNVWRKWLWLLRGKPGVTEQQLLEFKPNISLVCEPLFGRRVKTMDGTRMLTVRPSIRRGKRSRIKIYLEALDIVREFNQVEDLMRLGVFRREVTQIAGLEEIDRPFYDLVMRELQRRTISPQQVRKLAQRMPTGSAIQRALLELGEDKDLLLAAE
ncbi:hypothetical protein K2Q00_01140 [Patescibacteria group bacterium]|nr:hypothetical protein [Patescibacteria group bacterium]